MAANNELGLLFKINADPSQADAEITQFQAKVGSLTGSVTAANDAAASGAAAVNAAQKSAVATIASLREQYAGLADDANRLEALPFLSGEESEGLQIDRELMAQIRQEAAGLGAELGEDGAVGTGIAGSITELRSLRMAMYSTLGLVSFGFYITEWGRVASAIKTASEALGGYGAAEQDFMKAETAYEGTLLEHYKQLNAGQLEELSLITDIHKRRVTELQFEIDNAKVSEQAFEDQRKALTAQIDQHRILEQSLSQIGFLAHALGVAWDFYEEKVEGTGKALEKADQDETKAGESIIQMKMELKDAEAAWNKATAAADKHGDAAKRAADRARAAAQREAERARKAAEREDEEIGKREEARVQRALEQARRKAAEEARQQEQFNRGMASVLHAGMPGLPAGILQQSVAANAALEAAGHIDAETRAVWNLQSALLGLQPMLGKTAEEHQFAAQMSDRFANAMGKNIAMAIVYGNSIGAAVEKALKASIAAKAAEAIVNAIYATGMGFLLLAEHDIPAAEQAFEAAAVFGAVGGAAAAVARAIPGGASGRAHGGSAGAGSASSASGGSNGRGRAMASPMAAGARAPQYPGGSMTVAIMGPEEYVNWTMAQINSAVETQGARLVSSHTKTSAPVGQ